MAETGNAALWHMRIIAGLYFENRLEILAIPFYFSHVSGIDCAFFAN